MQNLTPSSGGAPKFITDASGRRVWDPSVVTHPGLADLANAIEQRAPNLIEDVMTEDYLGKTVPESDMITPKGIVELKTGTLEGLEGQVADRKAAFPGRKIIVFIARPGLKYLSKQERNFVLKIAMADEVYSYGGLQIGRDTFINTFDDFIKSIATQMPVSG